MIVLPGNLRVTSNFRDALAGDRLDVGKYRVRMADGEIHEALDILPTKSMALCYIQWVLMFALE